MPEFETLPDGPDGEERFLRPEDAIADLKSLRALTANEHGAQRVAFTPVWQRARDWFQSRLADIPVERHEDAAGNVWVTLHGESSRALVIGSHLDSVPNGGWLDGCLGVLAGLEVERQDFQPFEKLLDVVSRPYEDRPGLERYTTPARPEECVRQTFCGT